MVGVEPFQRTVQVLPCPGGGALPGLGRQEEVAPVAVQQGPIRSSEWP